MKRLVLLAALFLTGISSFAQPAPKMYLGLSTGLNSPTGLLGLQLHARFGDNILVNGGFGLGSWGYKSTIGIRYEPEHKSTWCPFLSYSRATGIDSIPVKVEVVEKGQKVQKEIGMRLKPVNVLNFGVQKQWITSGEKRIYIELGYSMKLTSDPFEAVSKSDTLTALGKGSMNFASPGGLLFGFGVDFPIMK